MIKTTCTAWGNFFYLDWKKHLKDGSKKQGESLEERNKF